MAGEGGIGHTNGYYDKKTRRSGSLSRVRLVFEHGEIDSSLLIRRIASASIPDRAEYARSAVI